MTEERDRNTKIKDILPILWSSYEHIYEARETGTTSGINYLMIIARNGVKSLFLIFLSYLLFTPKLG